MACATLKRRLDFDPLYSPSTGPSKRRRMAKSFTATRKRSSFELSAVVDTENASPFSYYGRARLSQEETQTQLRGEVKRLRRRLMLGGCENEVMEAPGGISTGNLRNTNDVPCVSPVAGNSGESMKSGMSVGGGNGATKESTPLFTFKQVGMICERLVTQREEAIRQEYEQILSTKLAEQYDTFVKFTHDHIQKQFQNTAAPSYLS